MDINILLNETLIRAINFTDTIVQNKTTSKRLFKINFDFHVTSDEYHDITVLLYENDFAVKVPEKNLSFKATIMNYSTSITDLYKEGEVGLFHLELVEKVD